MRRATRSRFAVAALSVLVIVCFSIASLLGAFATQSDRDSGPQGAETQAIDSLSFTIQMSPATGASVGDVVTFFVNATSDIPSANLSFRIYFDARLATYANNTASGYAVGVTGNPGQFVTTYTYSAPGNWTDVATGKHYVFVRAYVQDNASTTINKQMTYFVNYNIAPEILSLTPPNVSPTPGVPVNLSLHLKDSDNDQLTVSWDFGDGGTALEVLNSTMNGVYSNQTHTWDLVITPGVGDYWVNYTLNISVEDGKGHSNSTSAAVTIYIPPNRPPVPDLKVTTAIWEPMELIPFEVSARDLEGDGIYWYIVFGDGTAFTDYTGPSTANVTVWNNVTHAYDLIGGETTVYNVWLYTTDGPADHNVSVGPVNVTILSNHAPVFNTIEHTPQTLELNVTIGYLNVTFKVETNDEDGDNLTVTWDLDDGLGPRVNTTEGFGVKTLLQWRNFTEAAVFNITVTVTDGRAGHEITRYLNKTLASTNQKPMLTQAPTWTYASGDAARPNETITITMKVADAESDKLTIVWDFGDGSDLIVLKFNETDYAGGNVTCQVTHKFTKVGTYTIRIWIDDNKIGYEPHNVSINATLTVKLEEVREVLVWDWWDYTSLSLFLMVPIIFVIYTLLIIRRRRKLDKEGINWDEYKTRKEVGADQEEL